MDVGIPPGRDGKVSVFVLGRYNADRQYVSANKARFERWVDLSFLTVHRSKGSEADYVILPEMLSVLRGRSFANTRTDDPVLALAMPTGDNYPDGEERRLFYIRGPNEGTSRRGHVHSTRPVLQLLARTRAGR